MSLPILEQRKKVKFLLLILGGIILFTLIIFWFGFSKNRIPQSGTKVEDEVVSHRPKININWETLKNPILETLEPFDEISPWPGVPGRKNPFLPY